MNYLNKFMKTLKLDDYNIFLDLNMSRTNFLKEMSSIILKSDNYIVKSGFFKKNINYYKYLIKSKIFNSINKFQIIIIFKENALNSLSFYEEGINDFGENYFCKMQDFLIQKLGKPYKYKENEGIISLWKYDNITIIHSLQDSVRGFEDNFKIIKT